MSYEQVWFSILVATVALVAGLVIWARHLRENKRLALRELIHEERMTALEKGGALPELPPELARQSGSDPETEAVQVGRWVQRAALAAGLVLVLGGAGMWIAFQMLPGTPELRDLQRMAPIGAIPMLVGVGLLLYTWVDRRLFREDRP